ncbi:mechanosensitive ion channel family protein [Halobaculum sp. MBLA0147]|uniref:mechanosensitive ion channel family protein n=1 Tax=Halobaculum sp. MBLA0147 TaxID=3079934 RepID=UPI0035246CC0
MTVTQTGGGGSDGGGGGSGGGSGSGGGETWQVPEWLLDAAQRVAPDTESQVLVSLLLLGVLAVTWIGSRLIERGLSRVIDDVFAEWIRGAVVTAATGLVVFAVTLVWRSTDEAALLLGELSVTGTDLVRVVLTVAVVSLAYSATRVTKRAIRQLGHQRGTLTEHQVEISHHLAQVGIYAFALMVVLGAWGVDLAGLLVGAGFAGIVFGLAARQTLGAVLAGFVVLFSRPFERGDWVEIGDHEGEVTDVTIVNTRLRTFDDEDVMIPNDVVTEQPVVNRSRRDRLRVNVDVGVDYATDVSAARETATTAMTECDRVADEPAPYVVGASFDDSAVVLRCRFWVQNPTARRVWEARTEVMDAVANGFQEAGITIPFPQRTVSSRGNRETELGDTDRRFQVRQSDGEGEGAVSSDASAGDGTTTDGDVEGESRAE